MVPEAGGKRRQHSSSLIDGTNIAQRSQMHIIGRDSPAMAPDAVPDPAWLHMVVLGTKPWATFEPVPHLRISPPNNEHVAQFYVDEAHLAKSVGRFIGAALANGDAALVVATSERIATIDSALASVVDVE